MPRIEAFNVGTPCWIELFTSDPDKARAYYGELYGWTSEDTGPEFGNYVNFFKDGVRIAGCMRNDGSSGQPDLWTTYLCSDDAQKTADAAAANGGQIHVAPMAVGDLGTFAFVTGADGAAVGIWQPKEHAGFGLRGDPGTPAWFELHTRDYAKALDFYCDVFRWETETTGDTDEFRYTVAVEGDEQVAGVMDASAFLPEGVPAHWSIYFGTADADADVARAVSLGGAVVTPVEDTPYGRLATVTDPTGGQFKFVQPPAG